MPFSHHSHSGQFCPGHAKDTLEEMVQAAIARGMRVYALTEHMPRHEVDFYPEEHDLFTSIQDLHDLVDSFYYEACRLRTKYAAQIHLLVGFESEWIRPESLQLIKDLQARHHWDMFVGSIHHVHTHPIDFDRSMYELARKAAGGSDERIFEDYFDQQYEMLRALEPPVVGHFDLIRLMSDNQDRSFRQFPDVWNRIERNLRFIAQYGGMLELNSSAFRKGLAELYPNGEICATFRDMGGRFCLSDDAHAVEQVGANYGRLFAAVDKAGIASIHYYTRSEDDKVRLESISTSEATAAASNP